MHTNCPATVVKRRQGFFLCSLFGNEVCVVGLGVGDETGEYGALTEQRGVAHEDEPVDCTCHGYVEFAVNGCCAVQKGVAA